MERVCDLTWETRFEAIAEKVPSGFEPLSGASTVSMHDLSEALDTLSVLLRELRGDSA